MNLKKITNFKNYELIKILNLRKVGNKKKYKNGKEKYKEEE